MRVRISQLILPGCGLHHGPFAALEPDGGVASVGQLSGKYYKCLRLPGLIRDDAHDDDDEMMMCDDGFVSSAFCGYAVGI